MSNKGKEAMEHAKDSMTKAFGRKKREAEDKSDEAEAPEKENPMNKMAKSFGRKKRGAEKDGGSNPMKDAADKGKEFFEKGKDAAAKAFGGRK
jgi:hypothetical protein